MNFLDQMVIGIESIEDFITFAAKLKSQYQAEALVHRYGLKVRPLSDEDYVKLNQAKIGIPRESRLGRLRRTILPNAVRSSAATEETQLLLWGSHSTGAELVYRGLGILVRSHWMQFHVESNPQKYGEDGDVRDVLREWTVACGANHPKTQATVTEYLLVHPPSGPYVPLDENAVRLARSLAPTNSTLAVYLYRCLQRVAAYQWNGWVRWPSSWLRGARKNPQAIPGASTYATVLKDLLQQQVMERALGHRRGKRSATYRLRVPLRRGKVDLRDFAARVGLDVDARGVVKRPK